MYFFCKRKKIFLFEIEKKIIYITKRNRSIFTINRKIIISYYDGKKMNKFIY